MFTPKVTTMKKRVFEDIQTPVSTGPTMFSMGSPEDSKNKPKSGTRTKLGHRTSLPKLFGVNATLREEQRKAVESMGFSSMLRIQFQKIDLKLMVWLLKNFDPGTRILNINGKKVNVTVEMVKSALGIPCSGKKILKPAGSNLGVTKYGILFKGSNGEAINLVDLEHKVQQSTEDGPAFKVLYMMLLCATVLLPMYGTSLDFEILEYLDDIDNIHRYNWGELVLDRLVASVEKYKNAQMTKVTGCILLLQVIFVTELSRMLPNHTKFIRSTQPYVEQWNQDEVSSILLAFGKHGRYEDSVGSRETSDTITKKTEDENKQQQFSYSNVAGAQSHNHALLKFTADHIQLLSTQMGNVEGAITQLLTNMNGSYASLANELLEFIANQLEILTGRMTNVRSTIGRVSLAKMGEGQGNFKIFEQNEGKAADESTPKSTKEQSTHTKRECEETAFKGASNVSEPTKRSDKHEYKKVAEEDNSVAPKFNIKQEPGIVQERQKNSVPRNLDFGSAKSNKNESSQTKDFDDIFVSICRVMPLPQDQQLVDNLLSVTTLNKEELVVQYNCVNLHRLESSTLNSGKWIYAEVINCVAYLTWCERKSCPNASRYWNLPTWFADAAEATSYTDEKVNQCIFPAGGQYKGVPFQCSTISIPIQDFASRHFLMCKVDIDKKIIEICDTLRSPGHDQQRLSKIRAAVIRLERVTKLWGLGSFRNSNWNETFKYRYSATLPIQPNGYDCGIYVCLQMMFPNGVNRELSQAESDSTRRRLVLKLYTCKENRVYDRNNVKIVGRVKLPTTRFETLQENVNPNNMTVGGIIQMIVDVHQVPCDPAKDLLTLSVAPTDRSIHTMSKFLVTLQNDDDLKNYVESCLDVGVKVIHFNLTWGLQCPDTDTEKEPDIFKVVSEINEMASELIATDETDGE